MTFCSEATSTFGCLGISVKLHHLFGSFKSADSFKSIPTPRDLLYSLELDVSWMSIIEVLPIHKLVPGGFDCFPLWFPVVMRWQHPLETSQNTRGRRRGASASSKAAMKTIVPTVSAVLNAQINYKTRTHTRTEGHSPTYPGLTVDSLTKTLGI